MIEYIRANKEWLFSGLGLAMIALIAGRVRFAIVLMRKRRFRRLATTKQYLDSIYDLYQRSKSHDRVCTCTSSWPFNPKRERVLERVQASSVAFLGPIRAGPAFLGVLWRYGISRVRTERRFTFLHREVPGLKFVVAGSDVVISDSANEKESQSGAVWLGHGELARLLRDRFESAAVEAVPLEERVAVLIGERVQSMPQKTMTVPDALDFLTQGCESVPIYRGFTQKRRLELLSQLLRESLPRNSLVYRTTEDGPDRVSFAPRPFAQFTFPALRICDTLECNLKCVYCPQHGENFGASKAVLPFSMIARFVGIARAFGFTEFRFTGGEPLGRSDELFQCVQQHLSGLPKGAVSIATNGERLAKCADALAAHPELRLKVSLDTLDEAKFRAIARVNADTFAKILGGLEMVKDTNLVGINTVVTTLNIDDIYPLIAYCEQRGFYLKVMDLNWYADQRPQTFYQSHFVRLSALMEELRRKYPLARIHRTVGEFGIPMTDYTVSEKTFVRVKDHMKGSTYAPFCTDSCPHFPCQEGLYQLTFTADGRLRACRHMPDLAVDVSEALQRDDGDAVKAGIEAIVTKFFRPAFTFVRDTPFSPPP